MRYTLFLHWPEVSVEDVGEDEWNAGMAAFHDYAASLEEAGVLMSAEVLQPTSTSTTVVPGSGGLQVQDGPYADTKDRLGGTVVIEVPDLDAALATEAHYLAVLLAELLPDEPEVLGLAALLTLSLARAGGRERSGEFLPLEDQDPVDWNPEWISRGETVRRSSVSSRRGSRAPTCSRKPVTDRTRSPSGTGRSH